MRLPGDRLGHYRILERLGAGGMGEVYRAHDERLDRDVAIKILLDAAEGDASARARLFREARAAAALNHPCICTIHEVGEADGQAYIAMELIDGRTLSACLARGALPPADVVRYGVQVAEALAHAHARQIVHRDLKSANIVVTSEGRIKVLDFGLAKRIAPAVAEAATRTQAAPLTEHGAIVGTIAYMAPEQLRGEAADARADVWALGVVLYELATGARPFNGHSSFEISANILNERAAPFTTAVPAPLRGVIERCLEKAPERRFQQAADAHQALASVDAGESPLWRAVRDLRIGIAAAAVVVAAIGAGVSLPSLRSRFFGHARTVESIAVLPLENLSGDAGEDFFADGMTEVLSTDLARLGGLKRVTARGSVVRYKGTTKAFDEIARELHVDALLTGSVQRSGNRVSITAHLLDPASGNQLWSNRYDRNLEDVLVLRNEIVLAIVGEIKAQLSSEQRAQLASAKPVNPDAFEAYLKGNFYWNKQTPKDFDLAEGYYRIAAEKDPGYALAYAGLAAVWMMRGDAGFQPPSETFPKASAFMAKALTLDDNIAELHVLNANHKSAIQWDLVGAEREFARALEANPNLASAHFYYADLLLSLRRVDEWDREIHRALELDPLNDFNWSFYAWQLNYVKRYDEAIPILQRLLPTGPNKASNYLGLWGAYFRKGQYREALEAARGYFTGAGDGEFVDVLGTAADAAGYRAAMKRTGDAMAAATARRHIPALRVARMYAHAGLNDAAIQWLEKAYAAHESPLMRLAVVWDWLDLHDDPRFKDLLRRLKLPE